MDLFGILALAWIAMQFQERESDNLSCTRCGRKPRYSVWGIYHDFCRPCYEEYERQRHFAIKRKIDTEIVAERQQARKEKEARRARWRARWKAWREWWRLQREAKRIRRQKQEGLVLEVLEDRNGELICRTTERGGNATETGLY